MAVSHIPRNAINTKTSSNTDTDNQVTGTDVILRNGNSSGTKKRTIDVNQAAPDNYEKSIAQALVDMDVHLRAILKQQCEFQDKVLKHLELLTEADGL